MNWLNNIKLRNKLLIFYGSLIVLAVSLVGLLTFNKIQGYIYEQSSKSYMQTMDQMVMNIDYKMNAFQELIGFYTDTPNFMAALSASYDSPADYSYAYFATLSPIFELERYSTVKNVIVFKHNDSLPDIGSYPDKPHIKDTEHTIVDISYAADFDWYQAWFAQFGELGLTDLIRLAKATIWAMDEDRGIASVIKPVIYNYEHLVGIVELQLKLGDILGEETFRGFMPDEHFFILDAAGNQLFANGRGGSLSAGNAATLAEQALTEGAGKAQVEDIASQRLFLYQANPSSGWQYIWDIPMQSLMLSARSIRDFTFLILLGGIAVSFLITLAIARVLTRRISLLAGHMEKQDDLAIEDVPAIDGRDEIGLLTKSYSRMMKRISELITELRTSQQQQKELEIKSLQAQISPHFLYNTLATIGWMAEDNEARKINEMVNHLAIFYRLSLNRGKDYLTIRQEIQHVNAYLAIQKIRLEDKIAARCDIEPSIEGYYTLKLILQPFVENAILHGAEHKQGTTHITIRGYHCLEEACIVFEVIDDGVGMEDPAPLLHPVPGKGGYGIRNVHEKIQLQYGHRYGVKLFSAPGAGTTVQIRVPIVEEPLAEQA